MIGKKPDNGSLPLKNRSQKLILLIAVVLLLLFAGRYLFGGDGDELSLLPDTLSQSGSLPSEAAPPDGETPLPDEDGGYTARDELAR